MKKLYSYKIILKKITADWIALGRTEYPRVRASPEGKKLSQKKKIYKITKDYAGIWPILVMEISG